MKFTFEAREKALAKPVSQEEMVQAENLIEILNCDAKYFIAAVGVLRAIKEGEF